MSIQEQIVIIKECIETARNSYAEADGVVRLHSAAIQIACMEATLEILENLKEIPVKRLGLAPGREHLTNWS